MKKNITINLFGQLYHIDEDAYDLLKNYEDNMQRYFSAQDGGEEIFDDIEHRVAELFTELNTKGIEAINIDHVQKIIQRIGNPEQIEEQPSKDHSEKNSDTDSTNNTSSCPPPFSNEHQNDNRHNEEEYGRQRRLYRDIKESMLGGVSSGLSHYLGVKDPIFIRIAWILLLILPYCPALIIYAVLWIVIPPAITPEERLRMFGKPVNPQTLKEEIISASQKKSEVPNVKVSRNFLHRILDILLSACAFVAKALVLLFLAFFIIIAFATLISLLIFTIGTPTLFLGYSFIDAQTCTLLNTIYAHSWQVWTLVISGIMALGLPLYILFRRIFNHDRPASSLSKRILYLVVWGIALATSILLSISISVNVDTEMKEQKRISHTRNGICLYGRSWGILDEGNWKVIQLSNAYPYLYSHCTHLFDKETGHYYIDIKNAGKDSALKGTLLRKEEAQPGWYQLEAIINTKGDGCYLFSRSKDSTKVNLTLVPYKNNYKSKIRNISWETAQAIPYFSNVADSTSWYEVQENSKNGDWCYVSSTVFYHHEGIIEYGISNDAEFTNHAWNGQGFGIYDIVLTPINKQNNEELKAI